MMASFLGLLSSLCFFPSVANDSELRGSLSFSTLEEGKE
jgi:hypothetical protein